MKILLRHLISVVLGIALLAMNPMPAYSQSMTGIHTIDASDFTESVARITFNEFKYGDSNPIYTPEKYGANESGPTLTFRSKFSGQKYSRNASKDCPGAITIGCILGTPSSPLSLATDRFTHSTDIDKEPTLSEGFGLGTQQRAAYSILFDKDISSVGLTVGPLEEKGHTTVKVFDRSGKLLGQINNSKTGNEFFGFATDNAQDTIAGVQVSMLGSETDGYLIGDIIFNQKGYRRNKPPVVKQPEAQVISAENRFDYTLPSKTFIDPEGDPLTIDVDPKVLPNWLHYDKAKQQFYGTPKNTDRGSIDITITATDTANNKVNTSLPVTVQAKLLLSGKNIPEQFVTEDQDYSYTIPSDLFTPDDVSLTYDIETEELPIGLTFDGKKITGKPQLLTSQKSPYPIKLTATLNSRSGKQTLTIPFQITVEPTLIQSDAEIPEQFATEGQDFKYIIPDRLYYPIDKSVQYTIDPDQLPTGLSFDGHKITGKPKQKTSLKSPYSITLTVSLSNKTSKPTLTFPFTFTVEPAFVRTGATIPNKYITEEQDFSYLIPDNLFSPKDSSVKYFIDTDQLPTGLSYDIKTIAGKPKQGTSKKEPYTIQIKAILKNHSGVQTQTVPFKLEVEPKLRRTQQKNEELTAVEQEDYKSPILSKLFSPSDGSVKYSIADNALPKGLHFDGNKITGQPQENTHKDDPYIIPLTATLINRSSTQTETINLNLIVGQPMFACADIGPNKYFITKKMTWKQAEAEAKAAGGHLAAISSEDEEFCLIDIFQESTMFWIGANDVKREGKFEWSNGEPFNFTDWESDQPDAQTSNEDYVIINSLLGGKWSDVDNGGPYGDPVSGIVEIEK